MRKGLLKGGKADLKVGLYPGMRCSPTSATNLLSGSRVEEKRRAEAAARGETIPVAQPAGGRGGR